MTDSVLPLNMPGMRLCKICLCQDSCTWLLQVESMVSTQQHYVVRIRSAYTQGDCVTHCVELYALRRGRVELTFTHSGRASAV